ncbi:MAG: S26 family signal peptidase [Halobacteria archaeon]|nr:S26 family signal peptidase [Halobacteria archaeon]
MDERWIEKVKKARRTETGKVVEDFLTSAVAVVGIAAVLWAVAGIWPPLVAVESGSMEPHMHRGDLIYLVDNSKFVPDNADAVNGVVTYSEGKESRYKSFGNYGDVIVYQPNGRVGATPIIHRAMKYVEKGERWEGANGVHIAQHSGFVTKGDNNRLYDQEAGISRVVKPDWVVGKAKVRVPYLGRIRLLLGSISHPDVTVPTSTPR